MKKELERDLLYKEAIRELRSLEGIYWECQENAEEQLPWLRWEKMASLPSGAHSLGFEKIKVGRS